ncbi:hypothetical protein BurJ1DRAFT_4889 [Burkholderiales bacterium JOSHI_001]|nr:hypothetical protein BurJ1DRAFT_4889 [Burkholderiales bacterium JOSHI_001]
MIPTLADALRGLDPALGFDDLRDILWLAQRLPAARPVATPALAADEFAPPPGGSATAAPPAAPPGAAPAPATPPTRQRVRDDDPNHAYGVDGIGVPLPVGRAARRVGLRAPDPLPDALALARALQPLGRRRRFGRSDQLAEEASAERFAQTGLPLPVLRPARERWFEIALLVDAGPTLAAWRPQVRAFERLLQRHGGFRRVMPLGLDSRDGEPQLLGASGRPLARNALLDRRGRRLLIVVSDCTGPAWYDGRMADWLAPLAEHMPLAVAQPFAPTQWSHTALGFVELQALAPRPGAANAALSVQRPAWAQGRPGLVLPVFAMQAASAGPWARMLMARGDAWAPVALLPRAEVPAPAPQESDDDPVAAELRAALALAQQQQAAPGVDLDPGLGLLRAFRAAALPAARQLAAGLALVNPLTLPVMRLVQHGLAPEGGAAALAQVLASGLFQPDRPLQPHTEDQALWQVAPAVRERLAAGLTRSMWQQVMLTIGRAIEEEAGAACDILAAIADPAGSEHIPPAARPFAEFAQRSAQRFRGARPLDEQGPAARWREEVVAGTGLTVHASHRVSGQVRRLAWSPDGRQLAVLHGLGVDLFGGAEGEPGQTLRGPTPTALVWHLDEQDPAATALAAACRQAAELAAQAPVVDELQDLALLLKDGEPAAPDGQAGAPLNLLLLSRRWVPAGLAAQLSQRALLQRLHQQGGWVLVALDDSAAAQLPPEAWDPDWVGAPARPLDSETTRRAIQRLLPRLLQALPTEHGEVGAIAWAEGGSEDTSRLMRMERLGQGPWVLARPRQGTRRAPSLHAQGLADGDGSPFAMVVVDDQGSLSVCDLRVAQHAFLGTGDQGVRGVRCAPDPSHYAFVDADGNVLVRLVGPGVEMGA